MLGLKLSSDPRWADLASKNIADILTDHAWCEQKAASSGISLIVLHSDKAELVAAMRKLVVEEWNHFERVLDEINRRGFTLGPARKDEYVAQLNKLERQGGSAERRLMDRLLINALIEARSCERFKLLHNHIEEPDLKAFYYELMVSEAGHYRTLIDLAKLYNKPEVVNARWSEMLLAEAEIMANLSIRPDRVH
jgi:tRNA 2-(methylsulfanyl)-N6-isopentenyladenosine37 hydroxylase